MRDFHCRYTQGYNDNSGLGPILARYLQDESGTGQILVLVINELGDHQMERYFTSTDNSGGMICEGQASMEHVFKMMNKTYQKSFQKVGGKYKARDENEKTCAIRLPPTVFFKVRIRVSSVCASVGYLTSWSWR